jgi:hypothetical protein
LLIERPLVLPGADIDALAKAMLPTILMRELPQGYFRFGGERYIYTTRPIFLPPTWLRAL